MSSKKRGRNTSRVDVQSVSPHGVWLLAKGREYFLPHAHFPWFRSARVSDVYEVALHHGVHLHWPKLDVDLDLRSLDDPARYPLVAR